MGPRKVWASWKIGQKGTVLLDEITEMPIGLQSRILKVLQEKRFARSGDAKPVEVEVRILAASSDKLDRALAEKRLHADLYYRLSAFTVNVPPLRQRKEEIKLLLRYSMHKLAKYYGLPPREFTPVGLECLPELLLAGNLKELETFVKRYLIAGDEELTLSGLESRSRMSSSDSHRQPPSLLLGEREEMDAGEGRIPAEILEVDDPERALGNREKRHRSSPREDRLEPESGGPPCWV